MNKRFTSLMTTIILSVFFAILSYGQVVDKTIDGLSYMVNSDEETVTLVKSDPSISGDIEIPGKINIWNKEMKVTVINSLAFNDCVNITSIKIPNTIITIKKAAFRNCSELKSIEIPESVTTIDTDELFNGCIKLASFTIPECITTIGSYMFAGCTSLTSMIIPNSVTEIDNGAFYACTSLESITLPNKLESIGDYSFYYCYFSSIELPASLTKIGNGCFKGCTLKSITIPENLDAISECAFQRCIELESVEISNSVEYIRSYAFADCEKLKTISFGNSLNYIGESAFENCSILEKLTFPNSLKYIKKYAFQGNTMLKSIVLGSGISSIEEMAFNKCEKIEEVYSYSESVPEIDGSAFLVYVMEAAKLYVPLSSIENYKSTYPWEFFGTILPISESGIKSVKARGIAIQSVGGFINISGLDNNEKVDFYGVDGKTLGSVKSIDGSVSFSAKQGTVVVAKIGKESVKIAVE